MDTHELAWAAGFFDGEGYVGAGENGSRSKQKSWPRLRIGIGQTKSPELLERFLAAVGIKAPIYGPRTTRADWKSHWAEAYDLQMNRRDDIHLVCWLLWPWLGTVKRHQFEEAFERFHAMRRGRVGEA